MLRPGRRRDNALAAVLALLLLFIEASSAASSVLGIDFGTLNFKAALVKPGIPLEIVLTKDSKRKETAALAFKPTRDAKNSIIAELGTYPERAYGGDALALQGRMPGEVFPNLKPLLASPSEAVAVYTERYPAVQAATAEELGTTTFKSSAFADAETPWTVEELLAMQLANLKRNAETMAGKGSVVNDAIITIPTFYTADERRAIETAAHIAGLSVSALVSDGLAIGLDYAKTRTFPEVTAGGKPEHHLVFDMGAGSTTATLLRFQGKSVKDVGRYNKTVQEVAVLGTGWDRTLGGDGLNHVILEDYIHKFLTKPVLKSRGMTTEQVKSNGRLMARVWKEAEKARQVLSANTETTSSFEELLPEVDFKVKLTRSDFEDLTVDFANRVAGPISDALAAAKMTMADVDSIILHGGVVRTPFVQKKLEQIAGDSAKLRSNVNADESAVFGAAFRGASLSPSFKVKEIRNSDVAGYPVGLSYHDGSKDRSQTLFTAQSPVGNGGTTKQVTFKNKDDFDFILYQIVNDVNYPMLKVQSGNLTASVKELNNKFGCEIHEVSTKFSIRLDESNGLPNVVSGGVSCEVEGTGKVGSVGDSVKDWLGFGKKKDQEALGEASDEGPLEEIDAASSSTTTSSAASSSSTVTSSSKTPEKPKKRTENIPVSFTVSTQGASQPTPEDLKRMKDRLAAFDRSDKARFAREEALNVLEAYTYYVRDFLSNDDYSGVSNEDQRSAIAALLGSTREWMEGSEPAKATEKTFKEYYQALKDLVDPILHRKRDAQSRPEMVSKLRASLEQTQKLMDMVKEQIEKASAAQAAASSHTSTASTSSSSAADDADDLEETSTDTAAPPKYTDPISFSPYSTADLTAIRDAYESITSWLEEKEAAQKALRADEAPVLLIKDIEAKASTLSSVMSDLIYKRTRAEKASASASSASASSSSASVRRAKASRSKKSSASTSSPTTTLAPDESATPVADSQDEEPPFVTVGGDEEMPSEEELLEMMNKGKERNEKGKGRPVPEKEKGPKSRDEL
nr:hypoxia up-regulated protein 1 [Quercus suber]